ncbi:hypothetical protein QFC21_006641 [Naganishia friedmannii]|uniref:Uncharacterized protein n=1 Tax=Naganishia friedmannii TaxID=89922 RepID=A0ACC2V160_9TREE|nr:hypothetical protein QFC21_006641 [Naganishia friedmannii]
MSFPTFQSIHSLDPESARAAQTTEEKNRVPTFDMYTATIRSLVSQLSGGTLTSTQIVTTYLYQIQRWNGKLKALISVAPRDQVMRLANERDEQRRQGQVIGVLHGIPVVVKDNIATDVELGMPTTAGSYALLIGKANLTELASYKSLQAQDGWSAVGGQTINVYNPKSSPGNSSAGSGVAVAAGFCPASVATETGQHHFTSTHGSIVLPALQSALYALKPTVGLISRAGVVPLATYFDTPGPMAKCVWDLAVMMDVMCAVDAEDPTSKPFRESTEKAFEQAIARMSSSGARIIDPADIPSAVNGSLWKCAEGARSLVVNAGFKEDMGRYLRGLGGEGGVKSVDDLIKFNEKHADIEMPPDNPGQDVLLRTLHAVPTTSAAYKEAVQEMRQVARERGLDAVFERDEVDVLFSIGDGGRHSLANMVGYPMGVIPLGVSPDGTPFGAIFVGRKYGERTLLGVMSAWEQAFGERPLPPMAAV